MPIFHAWSARTGSDCMGSPTNYGYFEGERIDVEAHVSSLPGWHNYSDDDGGRVVQIFPVKIEPESVKVRRELLERKEALIAELRTIDFRLKNPE